MNKIGPVELLSAFCGGWCKVIVVILLSMDLVKPSARRCLSTCMLVVEARSAE